MRLGEVILSIALLFVCLLLGLFTFQSILLILALILTRHLFNAYFTKNSPPGPVGLPMFGSLLHIAWYGIDEFFINLWKKYGKIFIIRMGNSKAVVISDYDLMKDLSMHPQLQGRPDVGVVREMMDGHGIIDSEGTRWKHQRRFVMHSLRDSGIGAMQMEEKILKELEKASKELEKSHGKAIYIDKILQWVTSNVIFSLAFNKAFDYEDPVFNDRLEKLNENINIIEQTAFVSLFPWLRPLVSGKIGTLMRNVRVFEELAQEFMDEHRKDMVDGDPRDILDFYLEVLNSKDELQGDEFKGTFSEYQLKKIVTDFFAAGTETSSTTIRWAIYYMLLYPDIQEKIHQEIDQMVGTDAFPTYHDRLKLPYTVATLQEVERLASVAPRMSPRSNPNTLKYKDYIFDPRCIFIFNAHAIHRDPKLWDEPDTFRPSRFIDSDGKVFRPPYLVPFGSGKRICVGEALAKMEIFFLFVVLMQRFSFHPVDDRPPKIDVLSGIVRAPSPFQVIVKNRN